MISALLEIQRLSEPVLIEGTFDRAANLLMGSPVRSCLEGAVDEDTTTARRDILLKGGLIPETRTPCEAAPYRYPWPT